MHAPAHLGGTFLPYQGFPHFREFVSLHDAIRVPTFKLMTTIGNNLTKIINKGEETATARNFGEITAATFNLTD